MRRDQTILHSESHITDSHTLQSWVRNPHSGCGSVRNNFCNFRADLSRCLPRSRADSAVSDADTGKNI